MSQIIYHVVYMCTSMCKVFKSCNDSNINYVGEVDYVQADEVFF